MSMEQLLVVFCLLGLLGAAVAIDVHRHRIPNYLLLTGLLLGILTRAYAGGWSGLAEGGLGLLTGFALFLPMYLLGGMAAGDVKLMGVTGFFLDPYSAMWAAFVSVIAGSLIGLAMIVLCGQLGRTVARYLLMTRARTYLAPEPGDISAQAFPYSIAILVGSLASLYWFHLVR
ncbi:prepilin peptidase [Pseudomonas sp. PDM15]|uniref:A24 family peptidase n=1 Tax=Pseudomonas sp. PDM15 TaxID=2769303 RepID=UPI00177E7B2C|nr:prepilin peptidase [Pseudomonas sp. PDM15]MBD9425750.1 prepilin peptidase [Pseudomonas sp. PDM15]